MVQVVATRKLPYGRRHILPGEPFDASEKDARFFVKVGWAELVSTEPLEPAFGLQTMDAPRALVLGEAAPEAQAHPQTYGRRDMTATPAGPTGAAEPSRSSPPGRLRRPRT